MISIPRDGARSIKSLIDSLAVRFMEEMDYTLEADNAEHFAKEIARHKTLGNAIKVPRVRPKLTPSSSSNGAEAEVGHTKRIQSNFCSKRECDVFVSSVV